MHSVSSCASDVPLGGTGFDQPTVVKGRVELATPRFDPLDRIAQLLQTCSVPGPRPACKAGCGATNHQQQQGMRVLGNSRAPGSDFLCFLPASLPDPGDR